MENWVSWGDAQRQTPQNHRKGRNRTVNRKPNRFGTEPVEPGELKNPADPEPVRTGTGPNRTGVEAEACVVNGAVSLYGQRYGKLVWSTVP